MEVVDYDKIKNWNIRPVQDNPDHTPHGYIISFIGESGRETRIACSPEELKPLSSGLLKALEQFKGYVQ
jgi:hypothetical protein